jgi:hypothetical protein
MSTAPTEITVDTINVNNVFFSKFVDMIFEIDKVAKAKNQKSAYSTPTREFQTELTPSFD